MKRGVWIAIAVGIVLILVGVVVILMFVPLGPALKTATPTPRPTEITVVSTPTITITPSGCGTGAITFLILGESQPPRGTDAIRLVKVDFDQKRINALALPSELWVNTPGLFARGIGGTTLNQVYYQGKMLVAGDDRTRMAAAVNLFSGTLQADFGYAPEHYLVIKQTAFSDFVNALNGVDVVLPVAVDGRSEGKGYYPVGFQHLTGTMALDLVRISAANEWDLFDRQELILQAVYQTLMAPQNWIRLPALAEAFHNNIFTDLSVSQILNISCILNQTGLVIGQEQVGPELLIFSGHYMLPGAGLGQYILQTVGK